MTSTSQIFAESFASDPLINWWDRSATHRSEMFEAIIDDALQSHRSTLCGDSDRALAIFELRTFRNSRTAIICQTERSVRYYCRFISSQDLYRLGKASWVLARLTPGGSFLHLQYFLTNPNKPQHGFGIELLDKIKEIARSQQVMIYLETGSPQSKAYFIRRGFEIRSHYDFAGGPRVWAMSFHPSAGQ